MNKTGFTLDIARVPVRIFSDREKSLGLIEGVFGGFISRGEPELAIEVRETRRDIPEDLPEDLLSDVKVIRKGQNIGFYTKAFPGAELGFFDPRENKAVFFDRGGGFLENHIRAFTLAVFQFFLFHREYGFVIHASGIRQGGRGYLFPGPSGSGKTTITALWPGASVVSDEFICIRESKGAYFMYSTPWKETTKSEAVIGKIIFPRKADRLEIKKVSPASAALELLSNIIYSFYDASIMEKALGTVKDITKKVPCSEMRFALDSSFWQEVAV